MNQTTKNTLLTTIKALVSAGLIYFLITRIDLVEFIANIRRFPMQLFPVFAVLFCATILIGGWRWSIFLKPFGKVPYIKLVGLYFVGYFFNNFLPSGVGGDVVRGYIAGKMLGDMSKAYSSVVAERVAGILATISISLFALPFVRFEPATAYFSVIVGVVLWGATVFFLMVKTEKAVSKILSFLPWRLGEKVSNFVATLRSYRHHGRILFLGFVASVAYQGALITVLVFTAKAAGSSLPIMVYYHTVPLVWVISLLPISLNALGVREASFAYFFQLFGETKGKGLLVSLSFFAYSLIAGVVGGILFAVWGSERKKGAEQNNSGVK